MTNAITVLLIHGCLAAAPLAGQATPQNARAGHPDPIAEHFRAAESYQRAGDFIQADREYRDVLVLALQRIGRTRLDKGSYDLAASAFAEALKVDETSADVRFDLAATELWRGDVDRSLKLAEPLLASHPNDLRTQALLGKIALAKGDFQTAVRQFTAAMQQRPDFDTAYSLAVAYLHLKDTAAAQNVFDQIRATVGSTAGLSLATGLAYREAGYLAEAEAQFKAAIARDPKVASAYSQLGLTYLQQGGTARFPEARKAFASALRLAPNDYTANFYLGVIRLGTHDLTGAQRNLSIAVRSRPELPDPYLYLGQAYLEAGQLGPAINTLRKAIALTANAKQNQYQVSKAHYMLAQALSRSGQSSAAAAEMKISSDLRAAEAGGSATHVGGPVVEDHTPPWMGNPGRSGSSLELFKPTAPSQPHPKEDQALASVAGNAYHNLGVIRAQRVEYEQASDYFTLAARWDPKIASLDRNWALASFRAKKYDVAVPPLERLLAKTPGDLTTREMLGTSYYMIDNHAMAAKVFRPLVADVPDNPGVLYAMGVSFTRAGDSSTGAIMFRKMLEQHPNVPEVHILLGEAYAKQDDYDNALREFRTALELDPKIAGAHLQQGMALIRQRKMPEAAEQFRQELAIDPSNIPAKYHLAYTLVENAQPEQAILVLNEVVQQAPGYADAYYQLGRALLAKGDAVAAADKLQTAVRLDPEQDYSFYQLAMAYRKLGRTKDAAAALERFRALKQAHRITKKQPEQE